MFNMMDADRDGQLRYLDFVNLCQDCHSILPKINMAGTAHVGSISPVCLLKKDGQTIQKSKYSDTVSQKSVFKPAVPVPENNTMTVIKKKDFNGNPMTGIEAIMSPLAGYNKAANSRNAKDISTAVGSLREKTFDNINNDNDFP